MTLIFPITNEQRILPMLDFIRAWRKACRTEIDGIVFQPNLKCAVETHRALSADPYAEPLTEVVANGNNCSIILRAWNDGATAEAEAWYATHPLLTDEEDTAYQNAFQVRAQAERQRVCRLYLSAE